MEKKPAQYSQFSLIMRLIAGGYLMYTAWDLREAISEDPLFIVAIVAFAVIGAALIAHAGWKLLKKDYEGAAQPQAEEPAENEEEPVA